VQKSVHEQWYNQAQLCSTNVVTTTTTTTTNNTNTTTTNSNTTTPVKSLLAQQCSNLLYEGDDKADKGTVHEQRARQAQLSSTNVVTTTTTTTTNTNTTTSTSAKSLLAQCSNVLYEGNDKADKRHGARTVIQSSSAVQH